MSDDQTKLADYELLKRNVGWLVLHEGYLRENIEAKDKAKEGIEAEKIAIAAYKSTIAELITKLGISGEA